MKELDTPPAILDAGAGQRDSWRTGSLQPAPAGVARNSRAIPRFLLSLLLCLTILAVFIPLKPAMPVPSLDMSWMYSMNQAVAQH
ncbi:MAG: hypothetical protein ACRD4Y_03495, partial [Candidatus Acidiferrales bacterium]